MESQFDERQQAIRNKVGNQAFGLLSVLLLLNETIALLYNWADPITRVSLALIFCLGWFHILCIAKDAMWGRSVSIVQWIISMCLFGAQAILFLCNPNFSHIALIDAGRLSVKAIAVGFLLFLFVTFISFGVKKIRDKRGGLSG